MNFFSKKLFTFLKTASLLSAFLVAGLYFGFQSWDNQLYVQIKDGRGLAASEANIYSSDLADFNQTLSHKVFSSAKAIKNDQGLGVQLGNFFISDSKTNQHKFVCQNYDFVEMRFESLDIYINGEPGVFVMQVPCTVSKDQQFIGPFWIPIEKMLKANNKKSFNFDNAIYIHTYQIPFSMVSEWILISVKFFNTDDEDGLSIHYNTQEANALTFKTREKSDNSNSAPQIAI